METDSEVFVPSDPAFKTVNYSRQAPSPVHSSLVDVAYRLRREAGGARQPLLIYTPAGYDPKRAAPYPTLYLSHGHDGNEVDWTTTGDAPNIPDNRIGSGKAKPMVVVMTNLNGFANNCGSNEPAWVA